MNLGAFAVDRGAPEAGRRDVGSLATFAGLGRREPALGILMTLFLLSLTGIPPTAGFFAQGLRHPRRGPGRAAGSAFLAVLAVLNAAAAAFYYLRVVVYMFMRDPATEQPALRHGRLMWGGSPRRRSRRSRSGCSRG